MLNNIIQLLNINKRYGDDAALHNINLNIKNGEFLTLLGPSGCGKTTLLRILAGFESPDTGKVFLNDNDITAIPPEKRHINMVFQNYALFPHMSVYDNVAFGLRCHNIPEADIKQRVTDALATVHLEKFHHRKPKKLSGGQQQRVAFARAVVNRPQLLLLDEPFSALDYKLRKKMQIELKTLQRDLGITFVFVTHDQEEALSMSDRIVVMNEGVIEQVDTARVVYEEPNNLFTAQFIGEANIFDTEVINASTMNIDINVEEKTYQIENRKRFNTGDKLYLIIRPEDFRVWGSKEIDDTHHMIPGEIEQVIYKGSTVDLKVKLPSGKPIWATEFFDEDDPNLIYQLGEKVWVEWPLGWEVTLPHE